MRGWRVYGTYCHITMMAFDTKNYASIRSSQSLSTTWLAKIYLFTYSTILKIAKTATIVKKEQQIVGMT